MATPLPVISKLATPLPASMPPPSSQDWTAPYIAWGTVATAVGTLVLAGGVIFAALQFFWSRRATRIVETGALLKDWRTQELWIGRSKIDKSADPEVNRQFANQLYRHINKLKRYWAFKELEIVANNFIEDMAALAERTEIYLRRKVADEDLILEHLNYDIISTYYALQDILAERCANDDLDYERFLHLAQRAQDYSKLHPQYAPRPKLVWAEFPAIRYREGDTTDPHPVSWYRKLRLKFVKPPTSLEKRVPEC